tara:strand:+ start:34 stop:852 length:819 start_codon:yes stop_codon:yes gene_type:complete
MHYYKRNIGDYHKKAGRLSILQHGAYTLLIDACYDREYFPTLDEAIDWVWASSDAEIEAVKFVLKKFFKEIDGAYTQSRIQDDLEKYQANSVTNKRIAIERERKRRETEGAENSTKRADVVNDSNDLSNEAPPNHKPLTINQLKDMPDLGNQAFLIIEEKEVKQDYIEERNLAFEDFWKQWSDNKKMVGKINTAPKSAVKTKFLNQTFPASKVKAMGIEAFNQEVELMLDLSWNAHSDIAKNDKTNTESSWFNYRSMYPAKFLSNAQWRDQA